ncbi:MAG TPA: GAF domain-containing protein [Chloroflexota bacterium]|nr:GAF domain-containing protein [Chloroflexota bacterium]
MVASAEAELVRLRTENAELRASIEARAQENALLVQMVTDVISTLQMDQVLRHIVDHLVSAFGCHAAFVYLWEQDRERLVLRGATERYRGHIGQIEMALGEGLVGWSALTHKPVMLREHAMDDPRFRYFPELEEESFQAVLTVPITGADGSVVAVISLHTVAPQEFTDEHVRIVASVAPILGGAIETSGLYESTTRKLAVLATLSGLVQTVRSGRQLDDALRALAETAVRNTASDLCVLILLEPGVDRLSVRSYGSGSPGNAVTGSLERQPWDRLATIISPAELGLPDGAGIYGSSRILTSARMAAPLVAAGEQLGLMLCYSSTTRQYGEDDVALLNIIANQAAIAVKNSQLADLLTERDMPSRLFRDLIQGPEDGEEMARRRAALLGCDLTRPHVPMALGYLAPAGRREARESPRAAVASLVRFWLAETYPGSLVHMDTTVLALVRLVADEDGTALPAALAPMSAAVEQELGVRLVGGLGRTCHSISEYRQGFAQAQEALRVARLQHRPAGVLHFDRLGATRYLTRIALEDELCDRYEEGVEQIARHDARNKGAALLHTLETYLACGGNITRASEQLYVHRNTLVQRLGKLREMLGFDPHDPEHWLPLRIALELRQLRGPR